MAGRALEESPANTAELHIAEAELFRLETIQEAHKASKQAAEEYVDAARELTEEVRRLEKAADRFLREAKEHRKIATCYANTLRWYKAHPVHANVEVAESNDEDTRGSKAS